MQKNCKLIAKYYKLFKMAMKSLTINLDNSSKDSLFLYFLYEFLWKCKEKF